MNFLKLSRRVIIAAINPAVIGLLVGAAMRDGPNGLARLPAATSSCPAALYLYGVIEPDIDSRQD